MCISSKKQNVYLTWDIAISQLIINILLIFQHNLICSLPAQNCEWFHKFGKQKISSVDF